MKDRKKEIFRYFILSLLKTEFLVLAGILFAVSLSSYFPKDLFLRLEEKMGTIALIVQTEIFGFLSPGPRYILYPLLVKLKDCGASVAIIVTLISSHVLIEPSTAAIEFGFFGYRFVIKRFIASFLLAFLAGLFTLFITHFVRIELL